MKSMLVFLTIGALLAGCGRNQPANVEPTPLLTMDYFQDKDTGCQYVGFVLTRGVSLVPRIAMDGRSHMGCKGVEDAARP